MVLANPMHLSLLNKTSLNICMPQIFAFRLMHGTPWNRRRGVRVKDKHAFIWCKLRTNMPSFGAC